MYIGSNKLCEDYELHLRNAVNIIKGHAYIAQTKLNILPKYNNGLNLMICLSNKIIHLKAKAPASIINTYAVYLPTYTYMVL